MTIRRAGLGRLLLSFFLVFTMLFTSFPARAVAASYGTSMVTGRTLNYNSSLVKAVGTQQAWTVSCYCFAYAYSQTIVTSKTHHWYEYDKYGGENGQGGASGKAVSGYKVYSLSSTSAILSRLYTSINEGHPCVLRVRNSSGGTHWVCVVGYTGVTDTKNLKTSNFLIIDSGSKWATTETATLSRYTLYTTNDKDNYNLRVSTKSVKTTATYTNDATQISGRAPITSTSALPSAATQTSSVSGPYYIIPSYDSNIALDVAGNKTDNRTNVLIWKYAGDASQQFYLIRNSDGTFSIQSALAYGTNNSAFLHTTDQYSINSRNVHLFSANTHLNSHWYVEKNADGTYSFRNANSALYLHVNGGYSTDGTNVKTYAWGNVPRQKFRLVPYEEPVTVETTYDCMVALKDPNSSETYAPMGEPSYEVA